MRVVLAILLATSAACSRCDDTWDEYAQAFFTQKCKRCHGAFGDRDRVEKDRAAIEAMLGSGRMPPEHGQELVALPSERLSPAERERIMKWIACGRR